MLSIDSAREFGAGTLPELLGVEFTQLEHGVATCHMQVAEKYLAPHRYLHGGTVVALADTACGYGTFASLPEEAKSFGTLELKTNFFGTARDGKVEARAKLVHGGRSTQVWDADVFHLDTDKKIASFRCTQFLIY